MITWNIFKKTLEKHPGLHLQFQYAANHWVNAAYHITEIKQAPTTSVDCGGVVNAWTEIIIQLWEPEGQDQEQSMPVSKALGIIAVVDNALPLVADAIVKIEFGNKEFDTRHMLLNHVFVQNNNLIVDLGSDTVQCKAIERGGSCGTIATGDTCSTHAKSKSTLINLTQANFCCTPGGGCC